MIDRQAVKQAGRRAFLASYWKCFLAALLLGLVMGSSSGPSGTSLAYTTTSYGSQMESGSLLISPALALAVLSAALTAGIFGIIIQIFLLQPIEPGIRRFYLLNRDHGKDTNFGEVLFAFNNSYLNIVKTLFLQNLFICLWSLLFVIPGIVKFYSYRMVPYILSEKPDLAWQDALSYSEEMMNGHKWECFVYDLSFLGWYIVSALTLGLAGIFYVDPYKAACDAELYTLIRDMHFNQPHNYNYSGAAGYGSDGQGIWNG